MNKSKFLSIVSILFIPGGAVRLLANRETFGIFIMEQLWGNESFFIYTYKLLGVFIIWIGLVLLICSRDLIRYRGIIVVSILALILLIMISLLTGFSTGLGLRFFLIDLVFSLFLTITFFFLLRN